MNKKKYITRQLVVSCTPDKSFYVGEYGTYIQAILESVAQSLGVKYLSEKQTARVFAIREAN